MSRDQSQRFAGYGPTAPCRLLSDPSPLRRRRQPEQSETAWITPKLLCIAARLKVEFRRRTNGRRSRRATVAQGMRHWTFPISNRRPQR